MLREALYPECLITHITNIWALTTKNSSIFYQNSLMTECLITHFPGIRALTNIYGLMNFKNVLVDWMDYYMLHIYMGAHHYVCVDDLSDSFVD